MTIEKNAVAVAAPCTCPEIINHSSELCVGCHAAWEDDMIEAYEQEEIEWIEDDGQPSMHEEYQDLYGGDECCDDGGGFFDEGF